MIGDQRLTNDGVVSWRERRSGSGVDSMGPIPQRRRTDRINVRLTPVGVLSRVLGDAGIAFIAVMTALVAQAYLAAPDAAGTAQQLGAAMAPGGFILAVVFVAAVIIGNTLFGVYSRQRTYPMRTKLIRLVQSAALAGAGAGVLLLLLPDALEVPRAAYVGAWMLTVLALPAARWWSWAYRLDVQARQLRQDMQLREASTAAARGGHDDAGLVLVIGGAGYIGSALLPKLLESGRRVRLLDVFLYGKEPVAAWLDHPNLEVVEADYRKFDKLVEAMQGVHTVVHLGGLVGDPACAWDEALTLEVNLTFTKVIAEIAKATGVRRFVFASTCSVYGASDEILDESSALHPVSLYARSKIGSERVLKQLQGPGFSVTLLRFGTIYGISGRTRFDLVVNLLTAKAFVDGGITVFGGDQWRPFVHVDDAAKALALVLEAPLELVSDRVYNVGSDEQNATLGEVGRLINRLVPDAEYVDSGRDGDRRNYRVSFKRIRDELGFLPEWTLEDGIRQVMEALASGRISNYRDPQYSNVLYLAERSDVVYRTTETAYALGLVSDADMVDAHDLRPDLAAGFVEESPMATGTDDVRVPGPLRVKPGRRVVRRPPPDFRG